MSTRQNKSHFWLPTALTNREANNQNNYKVHSTPVITKQGLNYTTNSPVRWQRTPSHRNFFLCTATSKDVVTENV